MCFVITMISINEYEYICPGHGGHVGRRTVFFYCTDLILLLPLVPVEPCAGRAAAAADNLWAPPIFVDRRAAADNLSARRRCCLLLCTYFVAIFDD